jgi:hypothetical protein
VEDFQDLFDILVCQKAQIGTSWHNVLGLGFEFLALTDENVEKVLEVFQEARVEVWTLLFFPLANGANGPGPWVRIPCLIGEGLFSESQK